MSNTLTVTPCTHFGGIVDVPGDKSISHRLAMLCALAEGESTIHNFLCSEDCLNTLDAVGHLGADIARTGSHLHMVGTGGRFHAPPDDLDMGNSGTGMRLLTGLLAGQDFACKLSGDASLCSRPMGRIADPLKAMGATVTLTGERGCAPIGISGGALHGISYPLPMASAQVKSCVLLAGLFASGTTEVIEPKPTRDHTEQLLLAMGIPLRIDGLRISLDGYAGQAIPLQGGDWSVPGDFSSAAFWITAAACRPGAVLRVEDVGLNPRRTALLDVLRRMGADIECRESGDGKVERMGDITVRGCDLQGTTVGGDEIPNLIDELPLVAVAGALASGETVIKDAAELRVKESDRITTMAINLDKSAIHVRETADGMVIRGGARPRGDITLDSFEDHRIALAMAILAGHADGPVVIHNTDCIATSYPGFEKDLAQLTTG
jgi:3-phosphoshikimate 1-carboxyvinyltransferase